MQEFNLCTAQCELCDRDLELIVMHWPGLCAQLPCGPEGARESGSGGHGERGAQRRLEKERKESHVRKRERGRAAEQGKSWKLTRITLGQL